MVLTVYFALFPAIGLSCRRRLADTSAKLDASVETSEPHDFTVREPRRSSFGTGRVHRIPSPTSVTIAKRPSSGTGWVRYSFDLGEARSGKFFRRGLDRWNRVEVVGEISFSAQRPLRVIAGATAANRSSLPATSAKRLRKGAGATNSLRHRLRQTRSVCARERMRRSDPFSPR
jgi:hypothetical protein